MTIEGSSVINLNVVFINVINLNVVFIEFENLVAGDSNEAIIPSSGLLVYCESDFRPFQ